MRNGRKKTCSAAEMMGIEERSRSGSVKNILRRKDNFVEINK